MNTFSATPESAAEGVSRLIGAGLAVVSGLCIRSLYLLDEPSNWLANLGISFGDNSFRTLSAVAIIGLMIGLGLYFRKGLWLIILGGLIAIAYSGYKNGYYTLNNKTSASVQHASFGGGHRQAPQQKQQAGASYTPITFKGKQYKLRNTKVKMNKNHLAWCWKDDNGDKKRTKHDTDGIKNADNSALAKANCSTGFIHAWK